MGKNIKIDTVTRVCIDILEKLAEERAKKSPIKETDSYSRSCCCCRRARPVGVMGSAVYCMLHQKTIWPVLEERYEYEKIWGELKPTKLKGGRWLTCDSFEKKC